MKADSLLRWMKKIKISDVIAYIIGNYRYPIYYSLALKGLMRKYIREQIDYRIRVMNKACYTNGECVECGCSTTALQMANKSCDGLCYPLMVDEWTWKNKAPIYLNTAMVWLWDMKNSKYILFDKAGDNYVRVCLNQQK